MHIFIKISAVCLIYFILYMLTFASSLSTDYDILILFIYIPIFLLTFWLPLISLIPLLLGLSFLSYIDIWSGFFFTVVIVTPVLLTYLLKKYSLLNIRTLYNYLIYYFGTMVILAIVYAIYNIPNLTNDIHTYFNENFSFMMLFLNGSTDNTFSKIPNLDKKITLISFVAPALLTYCFLIWFLLNYQIVKLFHILPVTPAYNQYLPKLHTIIFILLAIATVFCHKLLAKNLNLNYILYNILFILWLAFYYSGILYIWQRISSYKSSLLNFLSIVTLVFLFFETVIAICLVGFIVEANHIFTRNKNKHIQ